MRARCRDPTVLKYHDTICPTDRTHIVHDKDNNLIRLLSEKIIHYENLVFRIKAFFVLANFFASKINIAYL